MPCRATDDPAALKAMIAALQAENAKISATLRAHDQLIQALRLRIAKLRKQAFGQSSEKIEREIEQLQLALEDLMIAAAETDATPVNEADVAAPAQSEPSSGEGIMRRRPRVSVNAIRERRELDPGTCCPDCGGDLRLVGEDVSEILDMIAAQMKVVQIARLKKSCRRCEKMVQVACTQSPHRGQHGGCGPSGPCAPSQRCKHRLPGNGSPNSMTICHCIARTRSSPGWGPIFLTARWSIGAGGRARCSPPC